MGGDAPLFKLIRDGLLELDGEVPESALAGILPACPRGCECPARRMRWPAAFAAYRPVDEATRMAVSGSRWRRRRRSGRAASPPRRWRPARTRCRSWCRSAVTFGAQGAASVMVLDAAGRVGRVRIALEAAPAIRAGSFAATTLETGQTRLPVVVPQGDA